MDSVIIGGRQFILDGSCYIMGILNITPDSFSDGGRYDTLDGALRRAEEMVREGADIIDIGGESTRPGCVKVSPEEELERVIPVIERIKGELDVPVSIDTYKSSVAREAIKAGADMINDIWGFRGDEEMAVLAAESEAACVLMDNRREPVKGEIMKAMKETLGESIRRGRQAGVKDDKMILDPGIGFGKTYEQNLTAINRLGELRDMGFPVLLAASRKSVIGNTLNLPADKRLEGTLAVTAAGVAGGAAFLRVHDVKENLAVVRMMRAIIEEGKA